MKVYFETTKQIEPTKFQAAQFYAVEGVIAEIEDADFNKFVNGELHVLSVKRPMLLTMVGLPKEAVMSSADPQFANMPDIVPQLIELPPTVQSHATVKSVTQDENKQIQVDQEKDPDFTVYIPVQAITVLSKIGDDRMIIKRYNDFVTKYYTNIIMPDNNIIQMPTA